MNTVVANITTMSFRFKQFFIEDSKCAMKVGTDGVLLGAWIFSRQHRAIIGPLSSHYRAIIERYHVLDVGTGSGLIALMIAQQCPQAQIDAIDIDPAAIEQAKENVQISNFKSQISNYVSRLQDWKPEIKYDLIVSNPPYFQNSLKNPDKGRELARHTDSLSYEDLIAHSARLLSDHGQLALILPAKSESEIRSIAASHNLFLTHVTRVYSKESKPARRVLMAFERIQNTEYRVQTDSLILENEKGGRSAAYSELCKEFYL